MEGFNTPNELNVVPVQMPKKSSKIRQQTMESLQFFLAAPLIEVLLYFHASS